MGSTKWLGPRAMALALWLCLCAVNACTSSGNPNPQPYPCSWSASGDAPQPMGKCLQEAVPSFGGGTHISVNNLAAYQEDYKAFHFVLGATLPEEMRTGRFDASALTDVGINISVGGGADWRAWGPTVSSFTLVIASFEPADEEGNPYPSGFTRDGGPESYALHGTITATGVAQDASARSETIEVRF